MVFLVMPRPTCSTFSFNYFANFQRNYPPFRRFSMALKASTWNFTCPRACCGRGSRLRSADTSLKPADNAWTRSQASNGSSINIAASKLSLLSWARQKLIRWFSTNSHHCRRSNKRKSLGTLEIETAITTLGSIWRSSLHLSVRCSRFTISQANYC